jgi:hypothetical protein
MIPSVLALASQLTKEPSEQDHPATFLADDLASLQAAPVELQSHFVSGALHSIADLMTTDVRAATALLAALAVLLRTSVVRIDQNETGYL